ncbi:MAG: hypothetical protein L3K01_08375 [Thermoplasmata archaeon]|nr:hypothetical protein [Thermoplasmata archaeon]
MADASSLGTVRRIALSVGGEPLDRTENSASRHSAAVRAASARGVEMFDLSEAANPEAAWELTSVAAGDAWGRATVFVAGTRFRLPESGSGAPAHVVRLRGVGDPNGPASEIVGAVGVRFADLSSAEAGWERAIHDGASWISFPGHLLDANRVREVVRGIRTAGAEALLTNPLADGRLDGRWLSEGTLAQDGPPRPMDLASLQQAFAPVLPLGFLTAGRRRTLAQAAVGFVRAIGAVPSVRFRDLRQIAELVDPGGADPLSTDEVERAVAVAPSDRNR